MFKYLLVPSTGSDLDRPVVEMALRAAHASSAHLEFLHVRMDVKQVMVMLAGSGMNFSGRVWSASRRRPTNASIAPAMASGRSAPSTN